jgi:hypothetical protein
MDLYSIALSLHSVLRWVVLVAGLVAAILGLAGVFGRRPWTSFDRIVGSVFVISMDTQLVLGLILYVFLSPLTQAAFADMGAAMGTPALRFYAVEHIFTMVIAVVLAHAGSILIRRASDDSKKQRWAAIFYTLALLAILAAIPWPGSAAGRPLNPFWMFGGQ